MTTDCRQITGWIRIRHGMSPGIGMRGPSRFEAEALTGHGMHLDPSAGARGSTMVSR